LEVVVEERGLGSLHSKDLKGTFRLMMRRLLRRRGVVVLEDSIRRSLHSFGRAR
jgi:hypothetical protein